MKVGREEDRDVVAADRSIQLLPEGVPGDRIGPLRCGSSRINNSGGAQRHRQGQPRPHPQRQQGTGQCALEDPPKPNCCCSPGQHARRISASGTWNPGIASTRFWHRQLLYSENAWLKCTQTRGRVVRSPASRGCGNRRTWPELAGSRPPASSHRRCFATAVEPMEAEDLAALVARDLIHARNAPKRLLRFRWPRSPAGRHRRPAVAP